MNTQKVKGDSSNKYGAYNDKRQTKRKGKNKHKTVRTKKQTQIYGI